MNVPRLAKGKGYKGPEFYGCFNTGMAPAIFHSRSGKYVVGPELRCRDAMRIGVTLTSTRVDGTGRQRIWLFKSRKPAVTKFTSLCETQIRENKIMYQKHIETANKALAGSMAAVLALGAF